MTYPELESQSKRDEAASTLRRWRKLRDDHRQKCNGQSVTSLGHYLDNGSANFFDAKADGFREALKMFWS